MERYKIRDRRVVELSFFVTFRVLYCRLYAWWHRVEPWYTRDYMRVQKRDGFVIESYEIMSAV